MTNTSAIGVTLENQTKVQKTPEYSKNFSSIAPDRVFNDTTDFDISKLSMKHYFPQPIKIPKKNSNDFNDSADEIPESEPKISDFSHLGPSEQNKAKELLKVNVKSDFNNFDGIINPILKLKEYLYFFSQVYPNLDPIPNNFGDTSKTIDRGF